MACSIVPLSDRPDLLPVIAAWYFQEWGSHVAGLTLLDEQQRLEVFLQDDELPLLLVALEGDAPVAAAQLKFHERTERPERLHWLGGVYVHPDHRGRGLAETVIAELLARGKALGVRDIYLQTKPMMAACIAAWVGHRWNRCSMPRACRSGSWSAAWPPTASTEHAVAGRWIENECDAVERRQRKRTGCGAGRSASDPSVKV